LQQGRVALHLEQPGRGHATDLGHPTHVVADHVHDHQVFRPVFFGLPQSGDVRLIFRQSAPASGRALHRLRAQPVAVQLEKQFGRGGSDYKTASVDKGGVLGLLRRRQMGKQRPRLADKSSLERKGVVDLVAVAACKIVLNAVNNPGVIGAANRGLPVPDRTGVGRGPVIDQGQPIVDRLRLRIQAKPEQR